MNESNKNINRTTARKTHHKFYGQFRSDLGLTGGMECLSIVTFRISDKPFRPLLIFIRTLIKKQYFSHLHNPQIAVFIKK